jgi:DNA-binding response OmpR family regulator
MQPLAESSRGSVLVAEDDPFTLELVTTRLQLAGFTVYFARNGAAAIDQLGQLRLNALVLDINMPEVDGFGVLDYMRRTKLIERVPTLVLTARRAGEDVQAAIRLGAKDFLTKPFDDRQLIARVGRLCARRRAALATAA